MKSARENFELSLFSSSKEPFTIISLARVVSQQIWQWLLFENIPLPCNIDQRLENIIDFGRTCGGHDVNGDCQWAAKSR